MDVVRVLVVVMRGKLQRGVVLVVSVQQRACFAKITLNQRPMPRLHVPHYVYTIVFTNLQVANPGTKS